MLLTVAELPEYLRAATRLLADADRRAIVDHLAAHPTAGDLIEGTGGVRKLRWARDGRGKSGGVRVIYYFHSENAAVSVDDVRQERARQPEQGRAQRAGRPGGRAGADLARKVT